jgi:hypothetical protein
VRKTRTPVSTSTSPGGAAKTTDMPTTSEVRPSVRTRWNTVALLEPTASRTAGVSSSNGSPGTEVWLIPSYVTRTRHAPAASARATSAANCRSVG